MDLLQNNWTNPFTRSDLISISSGQLAPINVAHDLLRAYDVGCIAYQSFRQERLETQEKSFYAPLPKQKLKTFSDIKVKHTFKAGDKEVILAADRNLFAKMILIGQTRTLDMAVVLSYRLGPIPWSLAHPDGTLRKTAKNALAKKLKKEQQPVETIPRKSACVIDGMSLVQRLDGSNMTFGDVSNAILNMALKEGSASQRIDVVFDVYRDVSIKNAERAKRGPDGGASYAEITVGHRIKQWRNFLANSSNKTKLIQFLASDWSSTRQQRKLNEKEFYVTVGEICKRLDRESVYEVNVLRCCHEEADTRMILHAVHCGNAGCEAVVIVSEDTDVFVLSIAFSDSVSCPIYVKCGTRTRVQYFDVKKIRQVLGNGTCETLLGLHVFTGCDSVSAIAGKGKLGCLRLICKNEYHRETLALLGCDWDLSNELFARLEFLTCNLYSATTQVETVNEMRFNIFCAKKGEIESWQLPPCSSALLQHAKRANYQCAIWKRCIEPSPNVPNPVGHGWSIEEGQLVVNWDNGLPAPEAVMVLLSCECRKECAKETCTCLQNNMKCTHLCKLTTCANQGTDEESDCPDASEDVDDDDEDYEDGDE